MCPPPFQDKLKRLELDLEEERSGTEMLTERVSRSRDQIDQLRSELTQERSSKQDLELDKNAMERHVSYIKHKPFIIWFLLHTFFRLTYLIVSLQLKELRGRVADMEGQSRSSAGASQLESKIQELEERLRTEDRYRGLSCDQKQQRHTNKSLRKQSS